MGDFIVPLTGLPSIATLAEKNSPAKGTGFEGKIPFADVLQSAVENVQSTSAQSQENLQNLALGTTDDMHTSAIDAIKSSTAVSFASSMTSSIIRAYNELMRMGV